VSQPTAPPCAPDTLCGTCYYVTFLLERGQRSRYNGYGLDDLRFQSRKGQDFFTKTSIYSPTQWLTSSFSGDTEQPTREADNSSPSSADLKNEWTYTSIPPM
jgi:hypothetical protein